MKTPSSVFVNNEEFKILISEGEIGTRVKQLALELSNDFAGEEVLLLCVLKGSFIFLADLVRNIEIDNEVEFLRLSSYKGGKSSTGEVEIITNMPRGLVGKNVVIVEDIIDSGLTLSKLIELLEKENPKTLKTMTLLRKPECLIYQNKIDYIGFDIPNKFVIGYGLDYGEKYRNLNAVFALSD